MGTIPVCMRFKDENYNDVELEMTVEHQWRMRCKQCLDVEVRG